MKKKLFAAALALLLLLPIPRRLKDGGSVEYAALVYTLCDVKRLASVEEMEQGRRYREGWTLEILGIEVWNTVR